MAGNNFSAVQKTVLIFNYQNTPTLAMSAAKTLTTLGHKSNIIGGLDAVLPTPGELEEILKEVDSAIILQQNPDDGLDLLGRVRRQNDSKHVCFVYDGQNPPATDGEYTHIINSQQMTVYLFEHPGVRQI